MALSRFELGLTALECGGLPYDMYYSCFEKLPRLSVRTLPVFSILLDICPSRSTLITSGWPFLYEA